MEMSLSTDAWGTTAAFKGRISWRDDKEFKRQMAELVQAGYPRLLVDFAGVPMIDSAIIAELVVFHKEAMEKKMQVVFVVNPDLHAVLFDANLDQMFRIIEDKTELLRDGLR